MSFRDRKIVCGSTPLDESTSAILRLYEHSDQRVYEICCPHCREWFEIKYKDIQWPEGQPERVHCVCPACAGVIEEKQKGALVEAGRWRATRPEVANHHGFRLNALISPLATASWDRLAQEFLVSRHDRDRLRVFANTLLGEASRDDPEELDEGDLVSRCEDISLEKIPREVVILSAGVDVQDDRFECSVLGFDGAGVIYVRLSTLFYTAGRSTPALRFGPTSMIICAGALPIQKAERLGLTPRSSMRATATAIRRCSISVLRVTGARCSPARVLAACRGHR